MVLEHSDTSGMLEVAIVAARLAGQRAMEEIKYTKTEIKNNTEIVTHADIVCQKIIVDRIKETYPDHGFLAEEGPGGGMFMQPPRSAQPIWWVIDPIDGTNNYAHGLLCFAVSIAVVYEGRPIVAVIFDPATESMYTAVKDGEAQLNNSRITASSDDVSEFSSFGISSHFKPEQTDKINEVMLSTKFRNLGTTALHMAYVAKGAMVGMIATEVRLWDIAAGILLVELAGGVVTDLSGKPIFPTDPAQYDGRQYTTMATNKKTQSHFMQLFGA